MSEKLERILELVTEYVETEKKESWDKEKDWVSYSGPQFSADEYRAAISVLLDGWLAFGENGRDFEKTFPKYLGKKHGVLTNSGSSANLLAMSTLSSKNTYGLEPGAKFITPVVCFPTTINPIIQNGFTPVFVDVTLPDLNLDLDQVERILEFDPEIRGIVFAHVLGNPPDMDRLMHLVEKYNLIFVEDACDALGSTYDGKKLGSYGHISTCSFYPAHHMTMGEGGFVATDSQRLRRTISSLRDWGRACYCNTVKPGDVTNGTACGNRFKNWLTGAPEAIYDHRYVFSEIGYNLKPLDLQAAMGLEQLKKLDDFEAARRKNFKIIDAIFKPYEEYFHLPKATEKADPCWFAYLMTVKESAPFKREEFVQYLESNRIQTRSYFSGNILTHPGYRHIGEAYGDLSEMFPVAHKVTMNSFFLGTYIGLTAAKLQYVTKIVDNFFRDIK